MRYKGIVLSVIIFLICGELIVRLDLFFNPFEKDTHVAIITSLQQSAELKMVRAQQVPMGDSVLRIMVLGDSYIQGPGIPTDRRFSSLLRKRLLLNGRAGRYNRCLVLDVSRPANNNMDNLETYNTFNPAFRPQVVLLGYNLNDVENDLSDHDARSPQVSAEPVKQADKPDVIKSLYNLVYTSRALQFCLHGFGDYLKTFGYVFPNSAYDLKLRSYTQDRPNWVRSKEILTRLVDSIRSNRQQLMVVQMPEFDLLDHPKLFAGPDKALHQFFDGSGSVAFINPGPYFKNYRSKDLRYNTYDGHPNMLAHRILADGVCDYIRDTLLNTRAQAALTSQR